MDERQALFRTIVEHAAEDAPRLVYADWLQENGDEPRAEFIRTQCELAGMTPGSDRYFDLRDRERELWAAQAKRWRNEPPSHTRSRDARFERGFARELMLTRQAVLDADLAFGVAHPEAVAKRFGDYPWRHVALYDFDNRLCRALFNLPAFGEVAGLNLNSRRSDPFDWGEMFADLVRSGNARGLASLALGPAGLGDGDTHSLLGPDALPALRELSFTPSRVMSDAAVRDMIVSPTGSRLKFLNIDGPFFRDALPSPPPEGHLPEVHTLRLSYAALAFGRAMGQGASLRRLKSLRIRSSGLTCAQLAEIIDPSWRLCELNVGDADLRGDGFDKLLATLKPMGLRSLTLASSRVPSAGVITLVNSPAFASLRELNLSGNGLTKHALAAVADSPHLRDVRRLSLAQRSGRKPKPKHVLDLLRRLDAPRLRYLNLSGVPIGTDAAQLLSESDKFRGLRMLILDGCALGDEGSRALLNGGALAGLEYLSLVRNGIKDGLDDLADPSVLPKLGMCVKNGNAITPEAKAALDERFAGGN